MQSSASDTNLFFAGDVKSLSPEKSPIAMKDTKWYTHNSTVGFLVAGKKMSFCQIKHQEFTAIFLKEYGTIATIQQPQ